ncbi:hypothetical protein SY88_18385 [Clostridiales bacterium PH28_bin88]|nr:hypothetical protein SY88_18385 [Clostridiales bacterium PH28_bin88]
MTERNNSFWLHLHPAVLPANVSGLFPTFCLGGLSAFLFSTLVVTGVLLMLFYVPSPWEAARGAIITMEDAVPYGWLVRSVHHWAGQGMVITVFLHTVRVVWTKAYRPPREGNWVIGVALFSITVLLDFTGYLLMADATGRLAAGVAYGLAGEVPVVGQGLRMVFLGGSPDAPLAPLRLYVWHCLGLPVALTGLMVWHFWRVRRDGGVVRGL